MNVVFKEFTSADKADVLEMMAAFNAIDSYDFDLDTGEQNLSEFTNNESLGRLYLITLEGLNVGYLVLTFGFSFEYKGRDAFIDEFFIKENFRNKGIGRTTMDFVTEESKRLGVNAVHLEVESHNTHAEKLYLSRGYTSNNRRLLTKIIS